MIRTNTPDSSALPGVSFSWLDSKNESRLFRKTAGMESCRKTDQSCFWALIFTPGPMVEAVTQERMY